MYSKLMFTATPEIIWQMSDLLYSKKNYVVVGMSSKNRTSQLIRCQSEPSQFDQLLFPPGGQSTETAMSVSHQGRRQYQSQGTTCKSQTQNLKKTVWKQAHLYSLRVNTQFSCWLTELLAQRACISSGKQGVKLAAAGVFAAGRQWLGLGWPPNRCWFVSGLWLNS